MKFLVIIFWLFTGILYPQNNIPPELNDVLSIRGLTQNDITIPVNFDKVKSARNDAKLLLPKVKEMMESPLKYSEFMDELRALDGNNINILVGYALQTLGYKSGFTSNKNYIEIISDINVLNKNIISGLSQNELEYLDKHLFSIISGSEGEEGSTSDIFKYNRMRDSSLVVSKKTMDILAKLNRESIGRSIEKSLFLFNVLKNVRFEEGLIEDSNLKIIIGTKGDDIYSEYYDIIIDFGGNDKYNFNTSIKNRSSFIIDFSGNDLYEGQTRFTTAGALFSTSFIYDKSGDDIYKCFDAGIASAIGGAAIIEDESGNDMYFGRSLSIGSAVFGVGIVLDKQGNDTYSADSYSQGFGMTEGFGAIVDNAGNDSYLINALSVDLGRYEDHYISMCQGYSLGLRPYYAGGIGVIMEAGGNDIYNTDIFGQGGAYWYGLGAILDEDGHDKYNSYQYAQGSGVHLAFGILQDMNGWDFYSSNGVSQGCVHDYGVGILDDAAGNDNYSAYSLSQGAGNANGIGILLDRNGRDGYLNKEPLNTRGYGNIRREYGSLGIFADFSGIDYYSYAGADSSFQNSSHWGVFADLPNSDLPGIVTTNEFKVPFVEKDFTSEELLIMAKTIEPRFSKWSEYAFNKMMEDSINTAKIFANILGTEDHRETAVMRNMIIKIPNAISAEFNGRIETYMNDKNSLTEEELVMIIFLFGETGSPLGKESLYNITFDERLRIRSAAINSLGKLKGIENDTEFINKVSNRLKELALERPANKLHAKDIAFTLNNYHSRESFDALISLLNYDYFGVRFLAASGVSKYWEEYFNSDFALLLSRIDNDEKAIIALISSFNALNAEQLLLAGSFLELNPSEFVKYNLLVQLEEKLKAVQNKNLESLRDKIQNTLSLKLIDNKFLKQ